MCLCIKVAELNTLSDGKGITVIHKCSFETRWKIKEENANLFKLSQ